MTRIQGVKTRRLTVHQDIPDVSEQVSKPGFLVEVLREDDGFLKHFGQTTFTVAYKDTIKAFHWHKTQDDLWFVATGKAVIVLYDLRKDSITRGVTQVLPAGKNDYKLILIPSGVAHGYKVVSEEPVLLFYHSTNPYNRDNPDEERIPWNDPTINFNWGSVG